jgi:hypothetical protein
VSTRLRPRADGPVGTACKGAVAGFAAAIALLTPSLALGEVAVIRDGVAEVLDDEGRSQGSIALPGSPYALSYGPDRSLWAGLGGPVHSSGAASGCTIVRVGDPRPFNRWRSIRREGQAKGWGEALPGTMCSFRPTEGGGLRAVVWYRRGTTVWTSASGSPRKWSGSRRWRSFVRPAFDWAGNLLVPVGGGQTRMPDGRLVPGEVWTAYRSGDMLARNWGEADPGTISLVGSDGAAQVVWSSADGAEAAQAHLSADRTWVWILTASTCPTCEDNALYRVPVAGGAPRVVAVELADIAVPLP